jgi:hypothetical protein
MQKKGRTGADQKREKYSLFIAGMMVKFFLLKRYSTPHRFPIDIFYAEAESSNLTYRKEVSMEPP